MAQYKGSCHCGNVTFNVDLELKNVIDCNCSMCKRQGWLLAFTTEDRFNLKSGADSLSEYHFNTNKIHHKFCKNCGVSSFSNGSGPDGKEHYAINVRCLEGVELSKFEVTHVDGASK